MKGKMILLLPLLLLAGCSVQYPPAGSLPAPYIQEKEQLYLAPPVQTASGFVHGRWMPYMDYGEYMAGRSGEEFRAAVRERYTAAGAEGIDTLYIHVHPCGDAYYRSDIFPPGTYLDGDYDPFGIMTEEAHALGLAVHAWINPLRCQTVEQMDALPESFIVKQWTGSGQAKEVGERWYLDPSYPEVRQLVCSCAAEILDRYDVEGIHIDDYFYPTTGPEWDRAEFQASGAADLAQWRRDNCTAMVKALFDTVREHSSSAEFSISPQGNIAADYDTQYADVRLWGGTPGYCDTIIPQIYYGFLNETCPFEATLHQWEEIVSGSGVKLVVGLAEYKQGKADKWAGAAGEDEWISDSGIIGRQKQMTEESSACGWALYG